jgi:cell division protein FtsW
MTLLAATGLLLSVSGERGGFLTRAPAAVRVGAPIGGAPRLSAARAEDAS